MLMQNDKFAAPQCGSSLTIRVKYHGEDVPVLEQRASGDWIDLRAAKDVHMTAGEFCVIPLGISVQLPEGYEAHIAPRSSTFRKWGILQTNGVGVIDNTYCGDGDEWGFPALAMRETDIKKGDRICQFRLMPVMGQIAVEKTDHLEGADRGGFGSTGSQ